MPWGPTRVCLQILDSGVGGSLFSGQGFPKDWSVPHGRWLIGAESALRKRENTHHMAEANEAFAHYRV